MNGNGGVRPETGDPGPDLGLFFGVICLRFYWRVFHTFVEGSAMHIISFAVAPLSVLVWYFGVLPQHKLLRSAVRFIPHLSRNGHFPLYFAQEVQHLLVGSLLLKMNSCDGSIKKEKTMTQPNVFSFEKAQWWVLPKFKLTTPPKTHG